MTCFSVALLSDALCGSLRDGWCWAQGRSLASCGLLASPYHTMPSRWAMPLCLVMDYDPQSCWRGGGRVIVCLMLPRLKLIIPAQLPSSGLWASKVIFGHIQLAPKDQLADLFSLTAGNFVLFMAPSFRDCATVKFQSSHSSVSLALCTSEVWVTIIVTLKRNSKQKGISHTYVSVIDVEMVI